MDVENLAEDSEDFTGNVWKVENGKKVLIDAGTGDSWETIKKLEEVDKVVITHSHYDHVDNLPKIVDRFSPNVYAFEPENLPVEAEKVSEDDSLDIAGVKFRVFHTPGHRDDSICLYSPEENILFSGDLIFPEGGFGRTDLAEGNRDRLLRSIERISELEVDEMFCGHESATRENVNEQIESSLEEARKGEAKY